MRYHEGTLEKILEKATIENVDEHSGLLLEKLFQQLCYFSFSWWLIGRRSHGRFMNYEAWTE